MEKLPREKPWMVAEKRKYWSYITTWASQNQLFVYRANKPSRASTKEPVARQNSTLTGRKLEQKSPKVNLHVSHDVWSVFRVQTRQRCRCCAQIMWVASYTACCVQVIKEKKSLEAALISLLTADWGKQLCSHWYQHTEFCFRFPSCIHAYINMHPGYY